VETAYRLGLPNGWATTTSPMGAKKWKPEYSETLKGKSVVICPDADDVGRAHGNRVAESVKDLAQEIYLMTLPDGCHDLSDWVHQGGTAQDFKALLDQKIPFVRIGMGGSHESNFAPRSAPDFLAEEGEETVDWVLDDYLPKGGLVLFVAKPKTGKTTIISSSVLPR